MFVVNLGVIVWDEYLSKIYEGIVEKVKDSEGSNEEKWRDFQDQTPAMDSMDEDFKKKIEEKKRESLDYLKKLGEQGQRFGIWIVVLIAALLWIIAFLTEGGEAPEIPTFCVYLLSLIIFYPSAGTLLRARWKLWRHDHGLNKATDAHRKDKAVVRDYEN